MRQIAGRERTRRVEAQSLDAGPVAIREARVSDAAKCLEYLRTTSAEPGRLLPVDADEWDMPVQDEEAVIQHMAATPNCLMLVVEAEGEIVGLLTCNGGTRRSVRHATTLGVSLRKDYRDRGLGHQLVQRTIDWARSSGITRIELHVYVENARAIHLYEKFGFNIEGRRPRAYYHNSRYIDDFVMGLVL
jgi:RimJ/RimL family protein N-acetyltransferase